MKMHALGTETAEAPRPRARVENAYLIMNEKRCTDREKIKFENLSSPAFLYD